MSNGWPIWGHMPRSERFVNLAWRLVLMGLIALGGLLSIYWAYQGLLAVLAGHLESGVSLAAGILLGTAVYLLCRFRNDLVCS
jgi:hypothetical protein